MRKILFTDASLTFLVVSLVVLLFGVYPLVDANSRVSHLLDIVSSLVLISAAYSASARRGPRLLCIALGVTALGLHWVYNAVPSMEMLVLRFTSMILFLMVVTGFVLYQVLRGGKVTVHRVLGAIAVYLMFGLIWASAYGLELIHDPGAFDLGETSVSVELAEEFRTEAMGRLVYFSFVTMTTLGYGDISPKSPMAGNLAILQALVGQLYLAVILARIVSLVVSERNAAGSGDAGSP